MGKEKGKDSKEAKKKEHKKDRKKDDSKKDKKHERDPGSKRESEQTPEGKVEAPKDDLAAVATVGANTTPEKVRNDFGVPEIRHSELTYGKAIGSGGFADVYLGTCRGVTVAIKKLKRQVQSDADMSTFKAEVEMMANLVHPNINLLMGACTDREHIAIVIEYCPNGALEALVYDRDRMLSTEMSLRMLRDIARGMCWLHASSPPIVHRDLKPSNLLLGENNAVKICDFGLSIYKPEDQVFRDQKTIKGTPLYMPPEVIQVQSVTTKADVYSFALVAWELLARERPFQELINRGCDFEGFAKHVLRGERPLLSKLPENAPKRLAKLLVECWNAVPEQRPSFDAILERIEAIYMSFLCEDKHGRHFWIDHFALNQESVPWNAFQKVFSVETQFCPDEPDLVETACLKEMLATKDANGELVVTLTRFGKFASWFGPLRVSTPAKGVETTVCERVKNIVAQSWFHGFSSKEEAEDLLENVAGDSIGAFLVRFSESNPGCFTISFVNHEDKIQHQRIYFTVGEGFRLSLRDPVSNKITVFTSHGNLVDFVEKIKPKLGLSKACEGSRYRRIFMEAKKATASEMGYEFDAGNLQK